MKLIVIDDDCLVAGALKMILEAEQDFIVEAVGNDGMQAIDLYRQYRPDVLLMDIRMKEMDGLEAAEKIIKEDPEAKILLLTTFLDDEYIIRALKLGAKGYLIKQDYQHIVPAIKAVSIGQNVYGDEIVSKIPNLLQNHKTSFAYEKFGITEREYEIIELIADGFNNKEIAARLFLSEGTVRNYLSGILEKLDLRDRTQIAIFYYRH